MFDRPARHFPALRGIEPAIHECLVVPWEVHGRPTGTLWFVAHSADRQFDGEDARVLARLAGLISTADRVMTYEEESAAAVGDWSVFKREVAERFGVLPNFFCSAPAAAGLMEELWSFAKSAYLDSPLPSTFKERLFVHLSRFCEVRYCIVRHVGFLVGEGRPSGDPLAPPQTVQEVIALLQRPVPEVLALEAAVQRLEQVPSPQDIPAPGTQFEIDVFDALTVIFLDPRRSRRCRDAIRVSLGERVFEILTAFLAFVRTAHFWTETHPELVYEPDMIALMEGHPDLARLMLDPSDADAVHSREVLKRTTQELQHAEGSLRESEERLRILVESVTDYAIFTTDTEGAITSWNPGAARIFELNESEAMGVHAEIIFTAEDRAAGIPSEEMRRARENGRAEDERWHQRRDGRRFYASGVLAPLRANGVLTGFVKVARDITERKQLEDTLRRAHENADEANRAKDQFLAMLGHELRNPLAPIVMTLQLLRFRGNNTPEQEILERQVTQLTRMVDDLLDVARITQGKIDLQKRPIELREVLVRAMESAGPILAERRNHVDVQMAWSGLTLDADPDRMAQVLANLLTNAAKYSKRGMRIRLLGEREGTRVRFSVADQGIGIAPEMLESVFQPFVQQSQTLDRSIGGLGLGLAIVRSLVLAHGGTVRAESEGLGRGSTFVVDLPTGESHRPTPTDTPPVGDRRLAQTIRRILVVDDNKDAASALRLALEARGHSVEVAFDGASALVLAEQFQPSVCLVDIGLPGMDGYELGQRLRSLDATEPLRLLAVTGYGQRSDRRRALEAGFERHLVKPVDLEELLLLIAGDA